ncbi:hypothetical protein HJC23_014015, partial [Cyclotella cryptica]
NTKQDRSRIPCNCPCDLTQKASTDLQIKISSLDNLDYKAIPTMSTEFESKKPDVLGSRQGCSGHHHCSMFGDLRRGPLFKEDFVKVTRMHGSASFYLYCRIYNPSKIHSCQSPPLLVLHGGPSLPSDYLYPLAHQMPTTRSVIFYDQLGCGKSKKFQLKEEHQLYSIKDSVEDLGKLIAYLGLARFHLLGHSFGGILAYEFIKNKLEEAQSLRSSKPPECLSLILANAPCNMRMSLEESARLEKELSTELIKDISRSDSDFVVAQDANSAASSRTKELLRKRHECRTRVMPEPLANAILNRGTTAWSGPGAVSHYVASLPNVPLSSCFDPSRNSLPPVLLIRGEFDFITEKCVAGWRKIFCQDPPPRRQAYREEVMKNCSHYCHLESEEAFASLVNSHCFVNDY